VAGGASERGGDELAEVSQCAGDVINAYESGRIRCLVCCAASVDRRPGQGGGQRQSQGRGCDQGVAAIGG